MYLHTTIQVSGHVFVYYGSSERSWTVVYKYITAHLNCSMQIQDWSLETEYANTWLITWTVVYKYMTAHLNRCILRFKVYGHVFAYYASSERSCICILRFKWSVMYLHTPFQVIRPVFAYCSSSERSCICILRLKFAVMYLLTTLQVYMTDHLNRSIQIHDRSLEPWYTNTWLITWSVVSKYMTANLKP
jgi:hypothetical protein